MKEGRVNLVLVCKSNQGSREVLLRIAFVMSSNRECSLHDCE